MTPVELEMRHRKDDIDAAIIACQTMAATAHHVSRVGGYSKDKQKIDADTIWWQQRSAHWSAVARRLMGIE